MAVKLILPITVGMIMLAMGLGLTVDDFKRIVQKPKAVALGLASQLLLLPLGGFLVAYAFSLGPEMALGMVLIAACPGGAHSNLFSNLAKGDTALSVTLTAVSGIITIGTIPLYLYLASQAFGAAGGSVEPPVLDMMLQIFIVVALPTALGMFFRSRNERLARKLEPAIKGIAILMLLLIVVGAVAKQASQVADFAVAVGLPVLVLNLSTMAAGWFVSRAGQLPREQAITIVIEVGLQNSALAVSIALGLMNSTAVAVPAIIYSLLVYATGGAMIPLGRRLASQGKREIIQ